MPRYIIIKVMKTRERKILESTQRKRVEIIQNVVFDHKGIKQEINNITIIRKATNTWKVLEGVWAINNKPIPPSSLTFNTHNILNLPLDLVLF